MNSIHLELEKQFSWQHILSQTIPLHFLLAHLTNKIPHNFSLQ